MSRIRKAEASDLEAVRACAWAAYSLYVERIGREPAPMVADFAASINLGNLHLVEVGGAIAGVVVFYAHQDHVHLENVAVSPDFQQRGLGSKLIEHVERTAMRDGFLRVELYTNAKMTENLGIYPRLGYEQFDRRTEDGFDRVYFRKKL